MKKTEEISGKAIKERKDFEVGIGKMKGKGVKKLAMGIPLRNIPEAVQKRVKVLYRKGRKAIDGDQKVAIAKRLEEEIKIGRRPNKRPTNWIKQALYLTVLIV